MVGGLAGWAWGGGGALGFGVSSRSAASSAWGSPVIPYDVDDPSKSTRYPLCSCKHWSASPPWLQAAPAAIAIATKVVSAISASEAPASDALRVWAWMHHGHWVIWAMPSAMSSFVLPGIAPSLNAF